MITIGYFWYNMLMQARSFTLLMQSHSGKKTTHHAASASSTINLILPKIATRQDKKRKANRIRRKILGMSMIAIAVLGAIIAVLPQLRFEAFYAKQQVQQKITEIVEPTIPLPPAVPIVYTPLIGPDGKEIEPVNTEFSIIIPRLGINAPIIASVDPLNPEEYTPALLQGVAHAKTSYFPNQDGATFLFAHSTNYEWFVKDLNAIFYTVKNLTEGDTIVLIYKGKRYIYEYKSREIVQPRDTSYLLPITGKRQLIL
ncbi:MAG: sortase, partial [Candidatus Methanomethylicaceae archaeon]